MNYKYQHRRYFPTFFNIPHEKYVDQLKKMYKLGQNRSRTLKDMKRLALMEATRACVAVGKVSRESRLEVILSKEIVLKILQSTIDSVHNVFIKINNTFRNERREVYEHSEQYLDVIRKYEINKQKLLRYTIKNICKKTKIEFMNLQKSVFHYIEKNDSEITEVINKFSSVGKSYALAPHLLGIKDMIEILQKYHEHLLYIINSSNDSTDITRYSIIIVSDMIYEYYGIEEEQILVSLKEKNELKENLEIQKLLSDIKSLISNNLISLFEI